MSETQNIVAVHEGARRIMLVGEITHESAAQVILAFISMNDQQDDDGARIETPIEFWIDSPGGSAAAAWAIVDVMQNVVDADIVTVGLGSISSAAILPLLFGDARLVMPHAEAMVHGVSRDLTPFPGRMDAGHYASYAKEFETDLKSMEISNADLIDALVEQAGWDRAAASACVLSGDDNRFFGGEAIVEAGLADAVFGKIGESEDDDDTKE